MSMMKAGAVMVGAGVAIEATYTYMYMNPNVLVGTIELFSSYLPGIPANSLPGLGGISASVVYGLENYFN